MRYFLARYMKNIAEHVFSQTGFRRIDPYDLDPYLLRDIGLAQPVRQRPYFEYL